jgi:hypothetical protein
MDVLDLVATGAPIITVWLSRAWHAGFARLYVHFWGRSWALCLCAVHLATRRQGEACRLQPLQIESAYSWIRHERSWQSQVVSSVER